jgi:hypothetical protein
MVRGEREEIRRKIESWMVSKKLIVEMASLGMD